MQPHASIWEGVYKRFSDVPTIGFGFDGQKWIVNSIMKMEALRQDTKSNTPLPPPSSYREGLLPLLTSLVYNIQGKVRILDFGGGIGFTYYQTMQALPHTNRLDYHIIEREVVCEAG